MPADQLDLDALRALRDPDAAPSGDAARDARAALLVAIDEERSPAPARRRRRRPRLGLIAVAVVAAAGVGGAGYAIFDDPDVSTGVLCASTIDQQPSGTVAPIGTGGARATCARYWRRGHVVPGRTRVPELTACNSGGAVYVYAAPVSVCKRLGMPAADDRLSIEDERFIRFRKAVTPKVSRRCISLAQGEVIVRRELRRAGLTGWKIRRGPPGPAGDPPRPCASLYFESGERRVTLVPLERWTPEG